MSRIQLPKLSVGDQVLMQSQIQRRVHPEPVTVVVTKVGRVFGEAFHEGSRRTVKFRLDNGLVPHGAYESVERVVTQSVIDDECLREVTVNQLKDCGLEFGFGGFVHRYPTEVLQQILAAAQQGLASGKDS